MGNCTYLMSEPCNTTAVQHYEVHVENENRHNQPAISYVKAVHVYVRGLKVSILKGGTVQVRWWDGAIGGQRVGGREKDEGAFLTLCLHVLPI